MGMRIRSKKHERAIVAEGEAILVMVSYATGEKHDLGAELRRRIVDLEAGAPQPGELKADA